MKKILQIGASSDVAISFYNKYKSIYNITRLSRDNQNTDYSDFDMLNKNTFPEIDSIDGLIYFPGTINLKPFKRLSIDDFKLDFEINVLGLIESLKFYYKNFNDNSSVVLISSVASKIGMPFDSSINTKKLKKIIK